jgi:hypothetical protein
VSSAGTQLHRHAEQGRREMIDLDARAHRVLARIQVRQQQLAARHLDVAHSIGVA